MATYNISLTKGTGIASFYYSYYDSTNTYRTATAYSSLTIAAYSGTLIRVLSVTFSSGYTYPVTCGSWTMYNASGTAVDPTISVNANRSLTISATKQATTTKYSIKLSAGTGVSTFTYYYYMNGSYIGPATSSSVTLSVDSGTNVYISSITPESNYGSPYTIYDSTNSKSWEWDDDPYVYSNGARTITISATVKQQTYYGRLVLNGNGGTFGSQTAINWPTVGYQGASGTGSAVVSIVLPTATQTSYIPTRDKYKFLGWATSSTATSATYTSGGTVSFTARSTYYSSPTEVNLYAVWEERPDIALFFWNGSDTADASMIAKGKPVKTAITAARWNNLLAKIKELSDAVGVSFSYTTVISGSEITAARFNAARTGLSNIKTALGTTTVLPAVQSSGSIVYATLFTGNGSIKGALNALIGVYNNG